MDAQRTGLQAAHVEQVVDQPVEPVQGLLGGGEQLGPVLLAARDVWGWRRLSTAALAEARGVRRSWLTADSRAVRILSASASGPAARGLFGEALLAQRDRGLGGEGLHDPPVGGGQRAAAQHQGELVVDGDVGVALVRGEAGLAADGGGHLPGGRVALTSGVTAAVGTALEQGDDR